MKCNTPVDVISVCSADGTIKPLRFQMEDEGLIDPKAPFRWDSLDKELNYSLFVQEGL